MKKSLNILIVSITVSLPLIAGSDREFIFDIHDATSATESYCNEALIMPVYQTATADCMLCNDFAGEIPPLLTNLIPLLKARSFKPSGNDIALFTDLHDTDTLTTVIASSLGSNVAQPLPLEAFRRSFGRALQEAEKNNIQTVHVAIPPCIADTKQQIAQEIAIITHLALYEYNALKTVKKPYAVKRVCVHAHMETPQAFKEVNIGLRIGTNMAMALCQARDWINAPANLLTPMTLAANAAQFVLPYIAKIETIIFEKEDIARMGLRGLLSVAQGSDQPCALVVHYLKSKRPQAPTIALIGKGITFNAGGLSIKTHAEMATMKTDMSGAAAVFTALNVIAYRNIPANIVVVAPLTENVINGSAAKPGDVITMFNGKTVEIVNTNADDRIIIADALAYAIDHYKPDYIIDIGSLTKSCLHTFGGSYAAIMGNDANLIARAQKAAAHTGEAIWHLPLNKEYAARLKSDIADLCNTSKLDRTAGAQNAGCFLQEFVGSTPWLHIDTAGVKQAHEYNPQGHSSFGIRLLVELVELLAQDK